MSIERNTIIEYCLPKAFLSSSCEVNRIKISYEKNKNGIQAFLAIFLNGMVNKYIS